MTRLEARKLMNELRADYLSGVGIEALALKLSNANPMTTAAGMYITVALAAQMTDVDEQLFRRALLTAI